jgi:hypothetical protein
VKVARVLLIASFALASATTLAATDRISAEDFVKKAGEGRRRGSDHGQAWRREKH